MQTKISFETNISHRADILRLQILGLTDYMSWNDLAKVHMVCKDITKGIMDQKKDERLSNKS